MFRYAQPDDDGLNEFLGGSQKSRPSKRADPALIGGVEPSATGRPRRRLPGFSLPVRRGLTGPLLAGAMMVTVGGNALFMQDGPHPAPLFSDAPATVASAPVARQEANHETPRTVASIPLPTARPTRVETPAHEPAAPAQSGELVVETQRLLTALGYYQGDADGIAGPVTTGALKHYEAENGLVPAGDVNEAIVGHLRLKVSRQASQQKKSQELARQEQARQGDRIGDLVERSAASEPPADFDEGIAEVQRVLAMLGYSPGPIDGQMGPGTRQAIVRFRGDNGLPALDVIDTMLIHALQEFSGVKLARGA
ncbi:MAG: peptidoglycan-binding protein [Rhodobiaceae bacterium]|nr:peptidoglycan-binding protein [Rhodobiaceae bacterium]MCC0054680.1 peptidoglycan-binding protein [Rhodobiaceae bacterium]